MSKPKPTKYMINDIRQVVEALAPECATEWQLAILSRISEYVLGSRDRDQKYWADGKELQKTYNVHLRNLSRDAFDGGRQYISPKYEIEQAAGWWLNVWRPRLLEQLREHFEQVLGEQYDLSDDSWWPISREDVNADTE